MEKRVMPWQFFLHIARRRVSRRINHRLIRTAQSLLLVLAVAMPAGADNLPLVTADAPANPGYHFGDGLHVPNSNWMLGGYSSARFDNLVDAPARAALDHLSLFLWWEGEQRWKFFSELDYENVVATHPAQREEEDRYLALERLYIDYALTDTSSVRAGKFLTPIGRWNEIHAPPLVWTTSRPLLSENTFPTNATGLMLNGSLPGAAARVEYSIYASNGSELRTNPDQDPFYEAVGLHLKMPVARDAQIGFSYANFEQKNSSEENKQLVGLDFVWTRNRYELSSEGVYRFSEQGKDWNEHGVFVQLAMPLTQRVYAVGRYENFHKEQASAITQLWVTGLNFRLTSAVVFKAEWVGAIHNVVAAPAGLMSSVSVMF